MKLIHYLYVFFILCAMGTAGFVMFSKNKIRDPVEHLSKIKYDNTILIADAPANHNKTSGPDIGSRDEIQKEIETNVPESNNSKITHNRNATAESHSGVSSIPTSDPNHRYGADEPIKNMFGNLADLLSVSIKPFSYRKHNAKAMDELRNAEKEFKRIIKKPEGHSESDVFVKMVNFFSAQTTVLEFNQNRRKKFSTFADRIVAEFKGECSEKEKVMPAVFFSYVPWVRIPSLKFYWIKKLKHFRKVHELISAQIEEKAKKDNSFKIDFKSDKHNLYESCSGKHAGGGLESLYCLRGAIKEHIAMFEPYVGLMKKTWKEKETGLVTKKFFMGFCFNLHYIFLETSGVLMDLACKSNLLKGFVPCNEQ